MSEEADVTEVKTGFSVVMLAVAALLSLIIGYAAGAFTGQPVLAAMGLGADATCKIKCVEATALITNCADCTDIWVTAGRA